MKLCQNFDLTPKFAEVDKEKRSKWKSSSENFSWNVIKEKLKEKVAGYVGYTKGHLHKRVEGHRQKASSIYNHYSKEHNTAIPNNFSARFNVIKKCTNKFDCLVNEILCIQDLKPTLNVQFDSIRAKVFM